MTDYPSDFESPDFQPFTPEQFDQMGKAVTENTNLEVMIDGGERKVFVFLINETDDGPGERDALDGALKVADTLGVPDVSVEHFAVSAFHDGSELATAIGIIRIV